MDPDTKLLSRLVHTYHCDPEPGTGTAASEPGPTIVRNVSEPIEPLFRSGP